MKKIYKKKIVEQKKEIMENRQSNQSWIEKKKNKKCIIYITY